ncbi:MAG: penicillin-binding protein 2 [Firmicutes bacterium]|nr:penicillin-binding protein 2 [Candidatus Fermentithermobacillaceae bacterium]
MNRLQASRSRPGNQESERRIELVKASVSLIFFCLLGLLVRYQLIGPLQSDRFVEPAFYQRYMGIPVGLSRGNIVDRHGIPLHYPVWGNAIARLSAGAGSKDPVAEKVVREASPEQVDEVLGRERGEGWAVVPEEIRYGPSSLARHVVGHVRTNAYVNPRDNVGEGGLEKWFQDSLSGRYPSSAGVVLTGEGTGIPGLGIRVVPPQDKPSDLRTTLDVSVQLAVEDVLDERGVRKGAALVLDAATGEVLAMASRPNYDQKHPERCMDDHDSPFVNRAISAFPPGSVWKTVVMALLLDKGYVRETDSFLCEGSIEVGDRVVACGSRESGHGTVTVKEALAYSCNSALIQCVQRIPARELVEFARLSGFGEKTGLELPEESPGVLPNAHSMYLGDLANLAIGQGYLLVTPLQVAAFYRSIVDGGMWKSPELIPGSDKTLKRLFGEETAGTLQSALLLATRSGTGQAAYIDGFGSAGKTGTAETGHRDGKPHAWFAGWTPLIAPKYVIVVFVEEGGDGPTVAAPIFHDIAERLLRPDTHTRPLP